MKQIFNKLVRDKIPQIIKKNGDESETSILSAKKFLQELKRKLTEESVELQKAKTKEEVTLELADVLEVLRAIMRVEKISPTAVEKVRKERARTRGAFTKRIFLHYTK